MKSALKISIKPMTEKAAKQDMEKEASTEETSDDMDDATESPKFEKYELEDAVNTLQKAMEIKHNAPLMKAIAPMLDKKKKAIKSLDDLRAVAKEKMGDDGDRVQSS